ncbi:MAG: hypothetical protein M3209_14285 [Acidobacteriota bacterium]|nr:hypothetical protein [Acidobacteriota bacterium]
MKYNKFALLVMVFCLTVTAFGQKYLEKPYTEWSKDEAIKVLNDSPWAQQYQSTKDLAAASQSQTAREQADNNIMGGRERGSTARNIQPPPVTIRLHSALPVRQAMVRMQQIGANYDKMSEAEKAKFDESAKGFLSCPICQSFYVVTMVKAKDSSGQSVEDGLFQSMTLEEVRGKVWLTNDKGEKREVVQFTPPKGAGDAAVFFFKRTDDNGVALLTPGTKSLKFVFSNEFLDGRNAHANLVPRNFEFKVTKMLVENKVEF